MSYFEQPGCHMIFKADWLKYHIICRWTVISYLKQHCHMIFAVARLKYHICRSTYLKQPGVAISDPHLIPSLLCPVFIWTILTTPLSVAEKLKLLI